MTMKVYAKIFMILLLPLVFIGGINFRIDPDYSLRNNYISPLVTSLLEGKLISGPVNVNSRLLKKEWIERLPQTPEILVLGSSRTLALSQDVFAGISYFNASVTNCTFQDMYAILNLVQKKGNGLPHTIIICVDQWLFGKSFAEKRWLENRAEAIEMIQKAGIIPLKKFPYKWNIDKEWIKELFSVRYLMRSVRYMGKVEKFEICQSFEPDKMMFLPDGSRSIPQRVIDASEKEISENAHSYYYVSKDEYFTELDKFQCTLFEGMMKYLTANHCKVILFIPPYHPVTMHLLEQSNQTIGVLKAESYLKTFALTHNLKLIGGNHADSLNLSAIDFYDGVHLKPESLNRFFKINLGN